jgi:hypothetical protein
MARKSQETAIFFTATTLVNLLGLSWSGFYKLRKGGIIGEPDARVNGRPVWLRKRVKEIEIRIQHSRERN